MSQETNSKESDFLNYTGNKFPRVLRLFWTLLILFAVYYLWKFSWPDLQVWLTKVK